MHKMGQVVCQRPQFELSVALAEATLESDALRQHPRLESWPVTTHLAMVLIDRETGRGCST